MITGIALVLVSLLIGYLCGFAVGHANGFKDGVRAERFFRTRKW